MNGIHDLGGMDGFGAVDVERNEPVFHGDWERRVFGLAVAITAARVANTDRFRHAIERMDPAHYLESPYYEHWLTGMATILVEKGIISAAELEARLSARFPLSRPVRAATLPPTTPSDATPRFSVGDDVIVRNVHPQGHTRCPRYVRGKRGLIVRIDPASALPDIAAHTDTRCRQFTYCVRFAGRELWGEDGGTESIYVDLWESYLDPA